MPFGEVYTALKTGVIDGAENNRPSYESTRHFEVAKYYSLDEHSLSPEVFVMSKVAWDKLDAKEKEIVRSSAKDSVRSEEHTSELQSLMRSSYAVFCLKKQQTNHTE